MQILLVEDDQTLFQQLKKELENWDFFVYGGMLNRKWKNAKQAVLKRKTACFEAENSLFWN